MTARHKNINLQGIDKKANGSGRRGFRASAGTAGVTSGTASAFSRTARVNTGEHNPQTALARARSQKVPESCSPVFTRANEYRFLKGKKGKNP